MDNSKLKGAIEAQLDERFDDAHALLMECFESAINLHDGRLLANALLALADNLLGHCPSDENPFERRKEAAEEALKLFREKGDERGEARALLVLASVVADRTLEFAESALCLAKACNDRETVVRASLQIANHIGFAGDKERATKIAANAVQVAREVGDEQLIAGSLFVLGFVSSGEPRMTAFDEMAKLKPRQRRWFANRLLAAASLVSDDDPLHVEPWWNECLAIARERSDVSLEGTALRGLSGVAHARGDAAKAAEFEAIANAILGPPPDFSEFEKSLEAGDMVAAAKTLESIIIEKARER